MAYIHTCSGIQEQACMQNKLTEQQKCLTMLVRSPAFTGDTLLKIIKWFENEGISVKQVYLGVAGRGVEAELKDVTVEIITVYGANFYEWIELRDLLGIDGRAVGLSSEGHRLYIPYWENLTEWASIPKESIEPVKEICQSSYKAIMQLLRGNGYDISKIGRIVEYKRRWLHEKITNRSDGLSSRSKI